MARTADRKRHPALFLLLASLPLAAACNRGGSQGRRIQGTLANFGSLAVDPARQWFAAADAQTGRIVVLDASDGSVEFDLASLGGGVGGIHYDHCSDACFVAVSNRNRVDVLDPRTYLRRATLRLRGSPFAIGAGAPGRLLIVTSSGLIDYDPASLTQNTLLAALDPDARIVTDREQRAAFVGESLAGGEVVVHRFDLDDVTQPPLDSAAGTLPGRLVGLALDFAGQTLWVGTDVAPGLHRLDAATLAPIDTIDIGDGLAGFGLSSTGLRLWTALAGAPLVECRIVEPLLPAHDLPLAEPSRERGVAISADNQALAAWDELGGVTTYPLADFRIEAPAVLKPGEAGTLVLHGRPGALWFLFLSGEPAPFLLDPQSEPDPRLLELSLLSGFAWVAGGAFDATGRAQFDDFAPTGLGGALDVVFQAAQTDSFAPLDYDLSNALVVRILDCP